MASKTVNILLFLAQGFEDLEAISFLDVFAWTHYRQNIRKAEITTTGFHDTVKSRCGLIVKPELDFSEINTQNYQALVLPGGFHAQGFEEAYDPRLHELARKIHRNNGYLATLCVGIIPIAEAGLLRGKRATTYPYSRHHDNIGRLKAMGAVVVDQPIVMDDRIISCRGPGSSLEVAFLLMEHLMGTETVQQVKHYMIYPGFNDQNIPKAKNSQVE